MNRHLAGVLSDYHFAPTLWARDNLLAEGVPAQRIWVTVNTVIDALLLIAGRVRQEQARLLPLRRIPNRRILVYRRRPYRAGLAPGRFSNRAEIPVANFKVCRRTGSPTIFGLRPVPGS